MYVCVCVCVCVCVYACICVCVYCMNDDSQLRTDALNGLLGAGSGVRIVSAGIDKLVLKFPSLSDIMVHCLAASPLPAPQALGSINV